MVQKLLSIVSTGRKVAVAIAFLTLSLFSLRAQTDIVRVDERTYDIRIFFRFDDATFRSDYLDNSRTLARLDSIFTEYGLESLDSVKVVAYSSPEGAYQYNVNLSKRRAESMRRYLVATYPDLESKLALAPGDESWNDLRAMVETDRRLAASSRQAILDIIDSPASPDVKEARLKAVPAYKQLYSSYFKKLRYAAFRLVFPVGTPIILGIPDIYGLVNDDLLDVPDEPLFGRDSTASAAASGVASADSTRLGAPSFPAVQANQAEPGTLTFSDSDILSCNPPRYHWPLFAVSTNVVYDLGFVADYMYFTPNFSVEVPIGQKWSVLGEYTFPWWVSEANDRAWEILKWDIGCRRWLSPHNPAHRMDVLSGHFVGLDLAAGYYDIEPLHKGYQGEFQTVGLEYGYAWKLNESWRLDAFIGGGWMGTHYRFYAGDSTDQHLIYQHHGKLTWFGPTKAGISAKYIFSSSGKYRRAGR